MKKFLAAAGFDVDPNIPAKEFDEVLGVGYGQFTKVPVTSALMSMTAVNRKGEESALVPAASAQTGQGHLSRTDHEPPESALGLGGPTQVTRAQPPSREGAADRAAAKTFAEKPDETGGIDLNPAYMQLEIRRDGNGVPLPVSQQPIGDIHIDGFIPIIINITPIPSFNALLGLADEGEDEDDEQYGYHDLPVGDNRYREFAEMSS